MASNDDLGVADQGAGGRDKQPNASGEETKQFRLKLAIFWGVIIAAIIAAFATGYPGWENYIAQEAAKRQLRAYIDVRPKGMTRIEAGIVPRIQDSFHNIGRTPAYDNGLFSRNYCGGVPAKNQTDQRRL